MTFNWGSKKSKKSLPAIMDTGLGKCWYNKMSNEERKEHGFPEVLPRADLPGQDIIALYECGMSVSELARKYGCQIKQINKVLFGTEAIYTKYRPEIKAEKVKMLKDDGYSVRILAERFACSENLIRRRLAEAKREEEENGNTI